MANIWAEEASPQNEARTEPIASAYTDGFPPFCFDTKGNADGFSVDLLLESLKAVGREASFKKGDWPDLRRDLEEGRLQVLPVMGRLQERENAYSFSFPYITMHGAIIVREGENDIKKLADLAGKRVAVRKGNIADDFLAHSGLNPVITATNSFEEALSQLADGKQDAAIVQKLTFSQLSRRPEFAKLVCVNYQTKELAQQLCFVVRKDNKELLDSLNEGLAIIMANGTFRRVYDKWFSTLDVQLRAKSRIVVGGDFNYPPYEYLDSNGQPAGFNVDLTRAIAETMGLQVDIQLDAWAKVREKLKNGQVDLLQGMFYSAERDKLFEFSPAHSQVQHAIITRVGGPAADKLSDLEGKSVIIMAGDIAHDLIKNKNFCQLTTVDSLEDALRMLASGKCDCTVGARIPALYLIQKNGWNNLRVSESAIITPEYCYAVPQGNADLLVSFAEGLAAIKKSGEYRRICSKWFNPYENGEYGLWTLGFYMLLGILPVAALLCLSMAWSSILRRRVQAATAELRESQAMFEAAMDQSQAGIIIASAPTGRIRYVNQAALKIRGGGKEQFASMDASNYANIMQVRELDGSPMAQGQVPLAKALLTSEETEREFIARRLDGEDRILYAKAAPIKNAEGKTEAAIVLFLDITERKRAEQERETTIKLLDLLNREGSVRDLAQEVTQFLQSWTGCEAVGIRLRNGDDFPYFETRGFPSEFVALENSLCVKDLDGQVKRDSMGHPMVECMCGNILCGRFDPEKPFFTRNGSFWSNSTTELLATTTAADRQANTRNRCNSMGYESVALIPLRTGGSNFGLVQLNDKRKDMFSPEKIALLEHLADSIASALAERLAKEELHRTSDFMENLIGHASAPILVWSPDFKVTRCNQAFTEITGMEPAEVVGRTLFHIFPAETRAASMDNISGALRSKTRHTVETLLRGRDGAMHVISWNLASIQGQDKSTPLAIIAQGQDITERKRAEDALRESEEMFRSIFEQAAMGICHVSLDGRIIRANQKFCDILGYAANELEGMTTQQVTHPEDHELTSQQKSLLLKGELSTCSLEKRYVRKEGSIVWANLTLSLLHGVMGEEKCFLAIVEDIGERKETQQALRESALRFRHFFECLTEGVAVCEAVDGGADFIFRDMNQAGLTLNRMSLQEICGKRITEIFPHLVERGVLKAMGAAWSTGEPQMLHLSDYKDKRISKWIDNRIFRLPSGQIVSIFEDHTEQRRLEESLRQREKMDAIGQLAGGVAHDFNNQLTSIMGYAEMLSKMVTDENHSRFAANILKASGRAADLTRQLLAFARKGKYVSTPLDMHDIIREVVTLLRHSLDKRIEIKLTLSATNAVVLGDPSQLQNAILNLALNARDAMPNGGELCLATRNTELSLEAAGVEVSVASCLEICVTDTGSGMTPEVRSHLFEPFFTTKEQGKGTGLGLAAVYGTVTSHKGSISVYSEPGRGSSFKVYLPALEQPAAHEEPGTGIIRKADRASTIMVVDDEAQIRELVTDMLQSLHYRVVACSSCQEAVDRYRKDGDRISLVLLDMVMPKQGGRDVYRALKAVNPKVKALLASGYSINGEAQSILEEGVLGFIQKPFRLRELSQAIENALGSK